MEITSNILKYEDDIKVELDVIGKGCVLHE